MSKEEKQIQRLKDAPSDYTYTEAKALAKRLATKNLIKEEHQDQGCCCTGLLTGEKYYYISRIRETL